MFRFKSFTHYIYLDVVGCSIYIMKTLIFITKKSGFVNYISIFFSLNQKRSNVWFVFNIKKKINKCHLIGVKDMILGNKIHLLRYSILNFSENNLSNYCININSFPSELWLSD